MKFQPPPRKTVTEAAVESVQTSSATKVVGSPCDPGDTADTCEHGSTAGQSCEVVAEVSKQSHVYEAKLEASAALTVAFERPGSAEQDDHPLEELPTEPEPKAAVVESVEISIEGGEVCPDLSWHEAAATGQLRTLQWLLSTRDMRELLDLKDSEKLTGLHVAATGGHRTVCAWLLKSEADPAAQAKGRALPLHLAASEGHLAVCQLLLDPVQLWNDSAACPIEDWPSVTSVDLWRQGPLHKAADRGHAQVVELLLKEKASVDKADREGDTPLHKAASAGHAQVIEVVLCRAQGRTPLDVTNSEGSSLLDLCVAHRRREAGDVLVKAGAKLIKDVRKKPPSLLDAVRADLPFLCTYILKSAPAVGSNSKKARLAETDENGRTAMLLATANGSIPVVQRLLEGHADPETAAVANTGGILGTTVSAGPFVGKRPVHTAADSGHQEVLAFLVEQRAALDASDSGGCCALFYAARSGHASLCQWLLRSGLAADKEDDTEKTPIHFAAANGHVAVCQELLADRNEEEIVQLVTTCDWEGFEPVHLAIREGHPRVCNFLSEQKAKLHAALDFGVTTLQLAADHGHVEVLQLLLADLASQSSAASEGGGCSAVLEAVGACRSDGRNAWLLSAAQGHVECCKKVWDAVGSPAVGEVADRDGRTAMLLAARNGHSAVCAWLSDVSADARGLAVTDACGWTPLHVASAEGRKEVVAWLLGAQADVGATDEGDTVNAQSMRRQSTLPGMGKLLVIGLRFEATLL